jgi:tetratricopeptide (TPR) repeat protein
MTLTAIRYRLPVPPSRPSMFCGRDDLVAELTDLVIHDEHLALIGPGGMGKSSVAKAIINEPLVMDKFADRRFFVTYDGLDPSTITFKTFMTHFAGALGMEIAGVDPVHQISTFLRSASALVVLDNAETFEEASASSVLRDIPPAIAEMANIPGVVLVLTSRSRRNAPNVRWITKDILPLDLSSAHVMFFQIYQCASHSEADEDISGLLKELDFHPLSINILANTAQQNGWSPTMLLKRWNDRHSKVLNGGRGKLQSLSDTMQLSLSSPSVQNLGEDGLRVLAIIAFLPQGLNEDLASDLLPSLPQVDTICDVLCMQSLVYRQDNFIKVLAPIRHYVRDSLQAPDSACLQEIRAFYYRTVTSCSPKRDQYADIIISDHLNIEQVVAFNLAYIPDDAEETCAACCRFLACLEWHLPRPTTLTPAISNIIENSSTWKLKAYCFLNLGQLYSTLSLLADAAHVLQAAEALYFTAGDPESMGRCLTTRAEMLRARGHFMQSQNLLEDLQRSNSWKSLDETTQARAWLVLDLARMSTFTVSADNLFVQIAEDRVLGLYSKIWHWRAKLYHGGDTVQVHTHLEDLFMQCTSTEDLFTRELAVESLAEVAVCEGRLSDAMDNLQTIVEMWMGQNSERVLWHTVKKAVVASKQGNYDLAREIIQKVSESSESLQFFSLRNAYSFLHRSYSLAYIELTADECDRAESYFTTTIKACDMQGDLAFKAGSTCGLGEIAFVRSNVALAIQHFEETRSLCAEMGMPPQHLHSCFPVYTLPDKFKGWTLFLEGLLPFTNDTT